MVKFEITKPEEKVALKFETNSDGSVNVSAEPGNNICMFMSDGSLRLRSGARFPGIQTEDSYIKVVKC